MKFYKLKGVSINNILLYILVFFGLFDTARNYTYLPTSFGYLKDISIFLLLILNVAKIKISFGKEGIVGILIVFAFFAFLRGFFFSALNYVEIIVGIIKFFELFILITLFSSWSKIFTVPYKDIVHFYVYTGTCILIFINIFGYFVPNPIISRYIWNGVLAQGFYSGRITVGQPPIAIYPVIISLLYLVVFNGNRMCIVAYTIALFLSTSNTGIVSVLICIILFLIMKKGKEAYFYVVMFLLGIACIYFFTVKTSLGVYLNDVISIYGSKIIKVLSGKNDVGLDIRSLHGTAAMNELENKLDILIGKGMYGYYSKTNPYRLVENTYTFIYCSIGLVGLSLWLIFFLKILISNFLAYIMYHEDRNLYFFLVTVVILCHMYTLDIPICYTIYFSYALFYVFCSKKGV